MIFYVEEIMPNGDVKIIFSSLFRYVGLTLVAMCFIFAFIQEQRLSLGAWFLFAFWVVVFLYATRTARKQVKAALNSGNVFQSGSGWSFRNPVTYVIHKSGT